MYSLALPWYYPAVTSPNVRSTLRSVGLAGCCMHACGRHGLASAVHTHIPSRLMSLGIKWKCTGIGTGTCMLRSTRSYTLCCNIALRPVDARVPGTGSSMVYTCHTMALRVHTWAPLLLVLEDVHVTYRYNKDFSSLDRSSFCVRTHSLAECRRRSFTETDCGMGWVSFVLYFLFCCWRFIGLSSSVAVASLTSFICTPFLGAPRRSKSASKIRSPPTNFLHDDDHGFFHHDVGKH